MFKKKKQHNDKQSTDGYYIENINNDYAELAIELKDTIEANNSLVQEMNHIRFSARRDRENEKCSLIAKISSHLLQVQDNLERIYKASENSSNIESIHKGIEMVIKELDKSIIEMNLSKIDCIGKPFNPLNQEIGGMTSLHDFEDDVVVDVLRSGYEFDGKVIRPSLVVVNKKPLQKNDKDGNNSTTEKETLQEDNICQK